MGCDYIVVNGLLIEYKNTSEEKFIELERFKRYFDDDDTEINSDCSDDEKDAYYTNKYLTVKNYKSLVLYENDKWNKDSYKEKYIEQIGELKNILRITKNQKRNQ